MIHRSVRLDDMRNVDLSEKVISKLEAKDYDVIVESISDSLIHYTVKKGIKRTTVQMTRDRHKPLYLELDIDALYIRDQKRGERKMKKMRGQGMTRSGGSRYMMYYLLFTILSFSLSVLLSGINSTLQWLSTPQNLVSLVLGFIGVYVVIYFVLPSLTKRWDRHLLKFDQEVLGDILEIIHALQEELIGGSKIQKCWNCFEDVNIDNTFCEYCGKEVRA